MKKTLLSAIAVSAVIGTANAAPTMEQRRAMCEDFGDVWVQETEACIPANPCESDDEEIRNVYCNDVPEGYPLKTAKYFNYEDCVNENPSKEVDCVKDRRGMTWAVASFPTVEQKDTTWFDHGDAWSQIGTDKDLSWNVRGMLSEYNPDKTVPGASVCHYRYNDAGDWYECTESE